MVNFSIRVVQISNTDGEWIGFIITHKPTGISVMFAFNLTTGRSYQLTLPGFDS